MKNYYRCFPVIEGKVLKTNFFEVMQCTLFNILSFFGYFDPNIKEKFPSTQEKPNKQENSFKKEITPTPKLKDFLFSRSQWVVV